MAGFVLRPRSKNGVAASGSSGLQCGAGAQHKTIAPSNLLGIV